MNGVFQTLMFRMYRLKRAEMGHFRNQIRMQAFTQESNCIFGYVFKLFAINYKETMDHKKT